MRYKVHLLLASLLIIAIAAATALYTDKRNPDTLYLKLGHSMDTGHVVHQALLHFQQKLSEVSNQQMALEIYPNAQLGSERDMVELLQIGSLAMTKVSAGALESFVPDMQVFSLPYVFKDNQHYWNTLLGDVGQQLLLEPVSVGLRGLGYFDAGSRSFYTCNKQVKSPEDLKGSKIRTMNSQTAVQLMSALGAAATPISFGELYTALQQGVVDGAENNAVTFYKSKHYEVCRNYSLDQHNSIPDIILVSQYQWSKLSEQQQNWLNQAMTSAVEFQRQLWQQETQTALTELAAAGVTITYPDKQAFALKVADYKTGFQGTRVGDLLNRIAQQ